MTTYIIFEEAKRFVLDEYWKDVLSACSRGKFSARSKYDPKTHTLTIRTITANNKTITTPHKLPNDPELLSKEIMNLYKEKLGLYSKYDLQIKEEEVNKLQKDNLLTLDCEWKKLKLRAVKDTLLLNYIIKLGHTHDLTQKEMRNAVDTINLGFQFKRLLPDDVIYQNFEVVGINSLTFNKELRCMKFDRPPVLTTKTTKKPQAQKFEQALSSYMKDRMSL